MQEQLSLFEEWRPVVGYEGRYSISNLGRLRSDSPMKGWPVGHIARGSRDSRGYIQVWLSVAGKRRLVMLHRLVAIAFLGAIPPGLEINHRNGVKEDCRLENLQFVTRSGNMLHAYSTGLRKGRSPNIKLTTRQVQLIRKSGLTTRQLANRFNVTFQCVWAIRRGHTWRT